MLRSMRPKRSRSSWSTGGPTQPGFPTLSAEPSQTRGTATVGASVRSERWSACYGPKATAMPPSASKSCGTISRSRRPSGCCARTARDLRTFARWRSLRTHVRSPLARDPSRELHGAHRRRRATPDGHAPARGLGRFFRGIGSAGSAPRRPRVSTRRSCRISSRTQRSPYTSSARMEPSCGRIAPSSACSDTMLRSTSDAPCRLSRRRGCDQGYPAASEGRRLSPPTRLACAARMARSSATCGSASRRSPTAMRTSSCATFRGSRCSRVTAGSRRPMWTRCATPAARVAAGRRRAGNHRARSQSGDRAARRPRLPRRRCPNEDRHPCRIEVVMKIRVLLATVLAMLLMMGPAIPGQTRRTSTIIEGEADARPADSRSADDQQLRAARSRSPGARDHRQVPAMGRAEDSGVPRLHGRVPRGEPALARRLGPSRSGSRPPRRISRSSPAATAATATGRRRDWRLHGRCRLHVSRAPRSRTRSGCKTIRGGVYGDLRPTCCCGYAL